MTRETGSGITPKRLIDLINEEVKTKSLNSISKTSGVGISALHRYQRGIGEPTTATLKKLADYFGVSVSWLRGYSGLGYEEEKERINLIDEHERLMEEQYTAIDERNSLMRESELIEKMVNYKDLVLEYKKVPSGSRLEALKILELISRLDNNSTDVEK